MANRSYKPDPLWIARRKKRLRQEDVADALKLDRITVYRAEKGDDRVHPDTLRRLCTFLSVPFDQLEYQEIYLPETSATT